MEIERAFCAQCHQETRHYVRANHLQRHTDDGTGVSFGAQHMILECCGCEHVHFRRVTWDDATWGDDFEPLEHVICYPDETKGRQTVGFVHLLPPVVSRAYREALQVFPVDAPILTAIGLRALAEAICIDEGCKPAGQNLRDSVQQLVTKGSFSQREADFLDEHRIMGNEAAHELQPPSKPELDAAFGIIESLMRTLYELPQLADSIRGHRARRVRQQATAPAIGPGSSSGTENG